MFTPFIVRHYHLFQVVMLLPKKEYKMYKAVYLICEVAECQSRPFFYYPFLRNESKRSIYMADYYNRSIIKKYIRVLNI